MDLKRLTVLEAGQVESRNRGGRETTEMEGTNKNLFRKTTAWKESRRWENETILEPYDWQKMQNELSPSSADLPDEEKIAHRMGLIQLEFPMLCRAGLIAADPHEIIGASLDENHVDFIYLGIFPRSLDRAIGDWTRGHVSIAMLQD